MSPTDGRTKQKNSFEVFVHICLLLKKKTSCARNVLVFKSINLQKVYSRIELKCKVSYTRIEMKNWKVCILLNKARKIDSLLKLIDELQCWRCSFVYLQFWCVVPLRYICKSQFHFLLLCTSEERLRNNICVKIHY